MFVRLLQLLRSGLGLLLLLLLHLLTWRLPKRKGPLAHGPLRHAFATARVAAQRCKERVCASGT